jgi:ceramide glucosyltransferase
MLLVSDSNVVVAPRYLHEIAGLFENPRVGIVTHPIAGAGESTLGSLFDNLHLCTSITPSIISANGIARRPIVVGKSMALRRSELSAIGGFEAVKDVLAEDYVMGTLIVALCDKEVAVARRPITNMSCNRSLRSFLERYARWNVLQRTSVGHTTYMAALLLNPWPFALAAFIVEPSKPMGVALFACGLTKGALEYVAVRAARPLAFPWFSVLALPCKDVLLVIAWAMGFVRSEISWRGRWFAVLEGTRLAPIASARTSIFGRTAAVARNLHLIVSRSKST